MGAMNDPLPSLAGYSKRVHRCCRHGASMIEPCANTYQSAVSRESFLCGMARCLVPVKDIHDAAARCAAYERAGYASEQIIEHDLECKRREIQRRAIFGMKERAAA